MKCMNCGEHVEALVGDCARLTSGIYEELCQDCRDVYQDIEDAELVDLDE